MQLLKSDMVPSHVGPIRLVQVRKYNTYAHVSKTVVVLTSAPTEAGNEVVMVPSDI